MVVHLAMISFTIMASALLASGYLMAGVHLGGIFFIWIFASGLMSTYEARLGEDESLTSGRGKERRSKRKDFLDYASAHEHQESRFWTLRTIPGKAVCWRIPTYDEFLAVYVEILSGRLKGAYRMSWNDRSWTEIHSGKVISGADAVAVRGYYDDMADLDLETAAFFRSAEADRRTIVGWLAWHLPFTGHQLAGKLT